MALSDRDCRHGRQISKCADCDLDHMEMAADAEARRVDELTPLRKQDTELIRQLVDALEHIHRCIPMGGFAQIHWDSASFEQIVQAAEAGRARLEGKQ